MKHAFNSMVDFEGARDPLLRVLEQIDMPEADKALVRQSLEGVSLQASVDFPPEVNERLATVEAHAQKAVASVKSPWPVVFKLLEAAKTAQTAGKRVFWISRAADSLSQAYGPVSACKDGCAHCCHIPVKITHAEAVAIGQAIGRKPVAVDSHQPPMELDVSEPCTFLVDSRCSIYAARPAVCRAHMNMDKDDLLCRLVPGASIPVPYLDTTPLVMVQVATTSSRSNRPADIRQWFPAQIAREVL